MAAPLLSNPLARRLFLHRHALGSLHAAPVSMGLRDVIRRIGFVQVDSINTVERAHHMILFSRLPSYRPDDLKQALEQDRTLWEHWTHDASILPIETFPYWKHRFAKDSQRLHENWRRWFREGYEAQFDRVLSRIVAHGPVTAADVSEGERRGSGGWWDWHPSKTALEWLWRTGQLAITRREGFQKVYDLSERVIPPEIRSADVSFEDKVTWACKTALCHLGFATVAELQAFWNAVPRGAVAGWAQEALAQGALVEIQVEGATGSLRRALARPDVLEDAAGLPEAPSRLRVLSPFDPALRDRARAEHLFGFFYRIEVFVPEAKRRWGYYVFPVLEAERLVGRLDAKAFKADGVLRVRAFWPEPGIRLTKARRVGLEAELHRLARFAGCDRVEFLPEWERSYLAP